MVNKGYSGRQSELGSLPMDRIDDITTPMSISIETKEHGIRTLSPSSMPEAESKGHKSRVVWIATYKDGSTICEYDIDGRHISAEQIDRQKIREFKLVDAKGRTVISQDIHPGQCFFYRRRTALQTGRDVIEVMHMFGWRYLIKDNESKYIENMCVLFESDMHVELGAFDPNYIDPSTNIGGRKSWKYPPQWRAIDTIPAE